LLVEETQIPKENTQEAPEDVGTEADLKANTEKTKVRYLSGLGNHFDWWP
jgi:hypothetical protein